MTARRRPRDPELAALLDACDEAAAAQHADQEAIRDRLAAVIRSIDAGAGVVSVIIDPEDDDSIVNAIEAVHPPR